jgi:hypothetical protein
MKDYYTIIHDALYPNYWRSLEAGVVPIVKINVDAILQLGLHLGHNIFCLKHDILS